MVRISLAFIVALLVVSSCASVPAASGKLKRPYIVWWDLKDPVSSQIEKILGQEHLEPGAYFVELPNHPAQVEPNVLFISGADVTYVALDQGKRTDISSSSEKCLPLQPLLLQIDSALKDLVPYAQGEKSFEDPSYLDGPDYAILLITKNADILVQVDNLNMPPVDLAYQVIETMKSCNVG